MVRAQDCYHVKKLAVRFYSMKQNPGLIGSGSGARGKVGARTRVNLEQG